MRSPHEQDKLKQAMARNEKFFMTYMNELSNKRNLRANALQASSQMPRFDVDDKGNKTQKKFNVDDVLADAEKIYTFLCKDGDMGDLANESIVKM